MIGPERFRHRLIAAVPIPFDNEGRVDERSSRRYVEWMASQPVGGVAVWAHTGRGTLLTDSQRSDVLRLWRAGLPSECGLVAAAGASTTASEPAIILREAQQMARLAADLGADAVLVHPPRAFRGREDQNQLVRDYHEAIAGAGLPLILFYLYEAAGGISYPPSLLRDLLEHPSVLGIKVATLDSVMTYQDVAQIVATHAPSKLLITGEDRFLGYSLMGGASAALIGMGAACTALQAHFLDDYWSGRSEEFLRRNQAIDDLARHTFCAPMEGYIKRMLWCLVHQGVIPPDAANDPWGPPLNPDEFDRIGDCLRRISAL
jgi:4-hydroxy-tetrahydrodipicolinate synthase